MLVGGVGRADLRNIITASIVIHPNFVSTTTPNNDRSMEAFDHCTIPLRNNNENGRFADRRAKLKYDE